MATTLPVSHPPRLFEIVPPQRPSPYLRSPSCLVFFYFILLLDQLQCSLPHLIFFRRPISGPITIRPPPPIPPSPPLSSETLSRPQERSVARVLIFSLMTQHTTLLCAGTRLNSLQVLCPVMSAQAFSSRLGALGFLSPFCSFLLLPPLFASTKTPPRVA